MSSFELFPSSGVTLPQSYLSLATVNKAESDQENTPRRRACIADQECMYSLCQDEWEKSQRFGGYSTRLTLTLALPLHENIAACRFTSFRWHRYLAKTCLAPSLQRIVLVPSALIVLMMDLTPRRRSWVCQSLPEFARVCQSLPEFARVCQSLPEFARACKVRRSRMRWRFEVAIHTGGSSLGAGKKWL